MKRKKINVWAILFLGFFMGHPSTISTGQKNTNSTTAANNKPAILLSILHRLEDRKMDTISANQDSVIYLAKKKPKSIIVEKVKYVKVYKTVPIYVPEKDTIAYKQQFPTDTVENSADDYISPVSSNKSLHQVQKRSFLYRLFHHN